MSKGILMFAHNNSEIDYIRMAYVNARLINHHLGVPVTVVTDEHSFKLLEDTVSTKDMKYTFDNIVIKNKDPEFKRKNTKVYRDTIHKQKSLSFYNLDRADAYDITPYDETILLDADYLILSNTLNNCWGNKNPLLMNYEWQDINFNRKFELDRLNPASIVMYWATVVYFKKDSMSEHFFTLCKHVRHNYQYYRNLYKWAGSTMRNDYVFSIAGHLLSGMQDKGIPQLPFKLYKSFDFDDIDCVLDKNKIRLYLEKHDSHAEYLLAEWKDLDLHIMNKWAINRVSDEFLRVLA
jgi:hypothetical protein